ncbi:hypothetical protein AC578_9303 [Pseudocercospora eumusae]|uniref:BRCT domain-containing protein n=1 Tax=Pseudocercospora eumusae TaxID=321146 RepID=A0A139HN57_9PEZI|nr:hypothetical protein AC578_9303 [Pseudocercospora eumusae]
MYGLSSDIATLRLPDAAVASAALVQIAYDRGQIYLRTETSANAQSPDIVATLSESAILHAPPSDHYPSRTIDVLKSTPTSRNRIPLHTGYTLDFCDLSLKLELTGQLPALSRLSSPPPARIVAPVIEQEYSAGVAESTSPKSKDNGEPAVMSPPGILQQHLEAASAVERTTEDPDRDPVSDHDADTEEDGEGDLDLPPDAIALTKLPTAMPIAEDSDEDDEIFQKPKPQLVYGKQRFSSPLKAKTHVSKAPSAPESSPKNVEADFSDEETARDEPTHDMVADLSEPIGSAEVAREAASRSIPRATPPEAEPTISSSGKLRSITSINKRKFERVRSPYDVPDEANKNSTLPKSQVAASSPEALDDDEEDDQAAEPPKKRGRPRESVAPVAQEESQDEIVVARSSVTKKRGRPRKSVAPVAQEESQDEIIVARSSVTKKRGRPRKSVAPAVQEETDPLDQEEEDDEVLESPKKRDRPRKSLASTVQGESLDEIVVAPLSVTRKPQGSSRAAASSSSPAKPQQAIQTPQIRKVSSKKAVTNVSPSEAPTALSGRTPKVLLSSITLSATQSKYLKANGATIVHETPSKRTNFICVVPDNSLPSTVKVLKTLAANKRVVSESWVNDSENEGLLLDLDAYVPPQLQANIGNNSRKSIFAGKMLYFTPQAASSYGDEDWQNVMELGSDTGARSVMQGSAIKGHQVQPKENVIFFGLNDERDNDAATLMKNHGRHVYDKKFFGKSIIRAELDLDDEEFRLSLPLPEQKKGKK